MAERDTSCGRLAENYARVRAAPLPGEAADWLPPAQTRRVADVCAGRGGSSRVVKEATQVWVDGPGGEP